MKPIGGQVSTEITANLTGGFDEKNRLPEFLKQSITKKANCLL
jgi:hypothetical protein